MMSAKVDSRNGDNPELRLVSLKSTFETQRLAGLYTRESAALEALKKSLLHQAFTGKLGSCQ